MEPLQIALLALGVASFLLLVALVVMGVRLKKLQKKISSEGNEAAEVEISDGVRYTKESVVYNEEGMNVTHRKGDFILIKNMTYRAVKGGELIPGMYTALSSDGSDGTFKLRVGGTVKNFVHGDRIVIGEGEEITAVSASVILR